MSHILRKILIAPIRFYQVTISPWLGPHCRFEPTCSRYAMEAIRVHGVVRGTLMGAWRILRCHPFSKGGYDPVRPRDSGKSKVKSGKREVNGRSDAVSAADARSDDN